MGLAGRGGICYIHTSGRGFTAVLAEGTLPCLRYHIRSERYIGHLLYHLIIFHIRSVVGRFDVSVQFLSQRTSFPP